ncbi:hypothetical protein ES704_01822 [subsurface metagenome]|jgi:hypothetical protein
MYLHEAIAQALRRGGNVPMTIEAITEAINQQRLYTKKDGSPIGVWNVGVRAVSDVSKSGAPMFDVLLKLRGQ